MIEMHPHVRIALGRFDHRRIKRGAPDRVDTLFRINVVRRKMQRARFIMNHSAAHGDGVLQCFISDPDLLQRVNLTG